MLNGKKDKINPYIQMDYVKRRVIFTLEVDSDEIFKNDEVLDYFQKIQDPNFDIDECLSMMSYMFKKILEQK